MITCIDTMKDSGDGVKVYSQTQIQEIVNQISLLDSTHISVDTPWDFPIQMTQWINAIHSTGRQVWIRSHFNAWEGNYGAVANMTPGQYLAVLPLALQGIKGLLQTGDIIDVCPEPENGHFFKSIANWTSIPAIVSEYLAFIISGTEIAQANVPTFVDCNTRSVSGWFGAHIIDSPTATILGKVTIDTYPAGALTGAAAAAAQVAELVAVSKAHPGIPIIIGEVGYCSPNPVSDFVQAQTLGLILEGYSNSGVEINGLNYWCGCGNSTDGSYCWLINRVKPTNQTDVVVMTPRLAASVVSEWMINSLL